MSFQISRNYQEEKNIIIFKLIGELDIYSTSEFKKITEKEYKKYNTNILVDGSELTYIDSTGLGAFIYLLKLLKDNGHTITLVHLKPNIKKLFFITKLDEMFIFEGEENE